MHASFTYKLIVISRKKDEMRIYDMALFLLMILPFLPMTLLLLLLRHYTTNNSHMMKKRTPPSPFKLPLIGNLHQLVGPLPHRSLAALSRKHGHVMLLRLGRIPALVVSSPDAARDVMKAQDHVFADRPSLTVPGRLFYGCKDVAFAPYGEYWRRMRKLSIVHLLSPTMVRTYRRAREEEVAFMLRSISRSTSSTGTVNLSDVVAPFAKDVVSRIVLGKCCRDEVWNEAIDEVVEESNMLLGSFHFGDYIPWLSWLSSASGLDARMERTFRKLDCVLDEIVKGCVDRHHQRRGTDVTAEDHRTFVDVLLDLEKDPSAEVSLTKENIKALIENMFGAGTDSTLVVLEWCMAELIRNPEAMKKLQSEVRGIATPKAMVTEDDLLRTNYLKAVIKETMRLHPPGPLLIPRRSMERTQVQGYNIPKGATVIVNCWAIGRDGKHWDAPDEFRPERFAENPRLGDNDFYKFVPFGAGRRVCAGIGQASSIMELALANLVYRFDWRLPGGARREDMDLEEGPGITSRMRTRLTVVAEPYSNSICFA